MNEADTIYQCQNNSMYPESCPNDATTILRLQDSLAAWHPFVCDECCIYLTGPKSQRKWQIRNRLGE